MSFTLLHTRKNHIAEARKNNARYESLVDSDPGLALNALFWCALHLVQAHAVHAYSMDDTVHVPENHEERRNYLYERFFSILGKYTILKDACEQARYELVTFTSDEVRERHDREFGRIRAALENRGIKF